MLERDCMLTAGIAYRKVAMTLSATIQLGYPHQPITLKSRVKQSEDGIVTGEVPFTEVCKCGHGKALHSADGGPGCNGVIGEPGEDGVVRTPSGRIGVDGCHCQGYDPTSEVLALERDVDLSNPNLARVHHDLPIRLQERKPPVPLMVENPIPGEPPTMLTDPWPQIETRELRYDKTQYPDAPPPVDRDVSEVKAGGLGLKPRGRLNDKEKAKLEQK